MPRHGRLDPLSPLHVRRPGARSSGTGQVRPIAAKPEVQEVTDRILEIIGLEPAEVKRWFTTNVLTRALAHLIGEDSQGRGRRIRCDDAGRLHTVSFPTAFDDIENDTGRSTLLGAPSTFIPANPFEFLEFWVSGADVTVTIRRLDGSTVTTTTIPVGYYSTPFVGDRITYEGTSGVTASVINTNVFRTR